MATRIRSQLAQSYENSSTLIKSKLTIVETAVNKIQLPERFKGTIVEKWMGYWKNLYIDYRDVFVGAGQQMKEKPIRSAFYGITAASAYYCAQRNPSDIDFYEQLRRYNADLILVHESCQNPVSAQYLKFLEQSNNRGLLRTLNLGVLSLIWLDNYDEALGLFKVTCPYLQPEYLTWHKRIVDVGILNTWWKLRENMIDFDINEANL